MIELKLLVKHGVQFGHQVWRWCPRMAPYIWGEKNGIHLIDVSKTAMQLEKAVKFLSEVAETGKPILWVGTKKAAAPILRSIAEKLNDPYVTHRWIGGTLTNFSQVKKSVTKLLHYEDILKKSDQYNYTKKEFGIFQKSVERLEDNVGGIRSLTWPVGALVVVDVKKEHVAVKEAIAAGVPVVALVDTNSDPSGVDYVIPGNDDIARSIKVLLEPLANAVEKGREKGRKAREKAKAEEAEKKAVADKKKSTDKKVAPAAKAAPKKTVKKEAPKKAASAKTEKKEPAKKAPAKAKTAKAAAKK